MTYPDCLRHIPGYPQMKQKQMGYPWIYLNKKEQMGSLWMSLLVTYPRISQGKYVCTNLYQPVAFSVVVFLR